MPNAPGANPDQNSDAGASSTEEQRAPEYLTKAEFSELLNKAMTAREKRFADSFGKAFEEKFSRFAEQFAPKPREEQADADGKASQTKDPEVLKMRQLLEQQGKLLEAERKARLDAEQKSRTQRAHGELQSALAKSGVRPEAMPILLDAFRGKISFDDEGNPLLPFDDGVTTVEAAVDAWAKSDSAKVFMPAPSAGGSGTTVQRSGGRVARDPASVPASQWTDADRSEVFRRRQEQLLNEQKKNPFSF